VTDVASNKMIYTESALNAIILSNRDGGDDLIAITYSAETKASLLVEVSISERLAGLKLDPEKPAPEKPAPEKPVDDTPTPKATPKAGGGSKDAPDDGKATGGASGASKDGNISNAVIIGVSVGGGVAVLAAGVCIYYQCCRSKQEYSVLPN